MADRITRRDLIKRTVWLPVLATGASMALSACGDDEQELTCTDTSGLTAAELSGRQAQEYTDDSPHADKTCDNCRFYVAAQANTCGTCQVVKGPIHPRGYCKIWAAKG